MAAADTGCFYGDGTAATDWAFAPCHQRNTTFRICCLPSTGDACLANGLCVYPGHYMYRGPCDNRRGAGCRSICPEINPNSWTEVQMCTPTEYCCSPERNAGTPGNCCNDGSKRFPLPDPISASESSDASSSAVATPTSASSPQQASSSSFSSSSSSSSSALVPTITTIGSGSSGDGSSSTGAIAGGVVGGVAALALLGAGAWWLLARRRRRRRQLQPASPSSAFGSSEDGRDATGREKGAGPAAEVEGRSAPVESDSRPLQQRRFEMSG
ncbi:hypothetical protein HRG_001043 [Hirsutella rhossiliensis]|uniref:Uncharacterized protein n=1 Tax=Hirsutella rhossiliensis TaxID=111463 RepID=A0A9P8SMV3_9HYPO|nr:uncharacterized protein HRG_01043 [Hirsutella rhossiliensis]KAH0968401.1 hypothetical protein HRG_01043 [Hirsutella rhossiliensis]